MKTLLKRRNDKVLQYKVIAECPPWFPKIIIEPKYETDELLLLWDIPEYTGKEDEEDETALRPDRKLCMKQEKTVFVLEQSVPWISNRVKKIVEKVGKYRNIVRSLKLEYPDHKVEQATFVLDCLGGYSNSLIENLDKLRFTKLEKARVINGIQKIVIYEARALINHFKILTL